MKTIQARLEEKQQEFAGHEFFSLTDKITDISQVQSYIAKLMFWPFVFQDVLQLNERYVTDSFLREIANHHRLEDKGHEQWFLQDMAYLCGRHSMSFHENYHVGVLFSSDSRIVRECCYRLVSEVFVAEEDIQRIILVLALESTGHIFFEKNAKLILRLGYDTALKYFSSFHLDVEKAHEMFDESVEDKLMKIELTDQQRRYALQMIDRVYSVFFTLFDELALELNHSLIHGLSVPSTRDKRQVEHDAI